VAAEDEDELEEDGDELEEPQADRIDRQIVAAAQVSQRPRDRRVAIVSMGFTE
jgi:hypothetical protein